MASHSHKQKHSNSKKKSSRSKSHKKSKSSSSDIELNSRNHPRIEDELGNIQKHRYHVRDLSNAIRTMTRESTISSRLSPAQQNFVRQPLPSIRSQAQLRQLIHTWIPILDAAFYWGTMQRTIKIVGTYTQNTAKRGSEKAIAYYDLRQNEMQVRLDESDSSPQRTIHYIGTIAHEMLHGFLHNFSCNCAFCTKNRHKVNGAAGHLYSGHGPLWANAMVAIQQALSDELFGQHVECGLDVSIDIEMEKSPNWQPRREQFERWGLPYKIQQGGNLRPRMGDDEEEVEGGEEVVEGGEENEESDSEYEYEVTCCGATCMIM